MTPATIVVPQWYQGPTGSGQGGWTSQQLAAAIGEPVTVAIKAPVPLETPMAISAADDGWRLAPVDNPDHTVLYATTWQRDFATTTAVSIEDATSARARFPHAADAHPVPVCFSCGLEPDSMHVHCGPLDDDRWATDWTVPAWAVDPDGAVNEGALWAAIDCTQAIYAGCDGGLRNSVTAQLAVEVLRPLQPGATYALVAWHGTYERGWDGRKRGAGGAAFDADGDLVARSSSFWIAL